MTNRSFSTTSADSDSPGADSKSPAVDAGPEFLEELSPLFQHDDEQSIRDFLNSSQFRFHPSAFLNHTSPQVVRAAVICLGLTGQLRHADRLIELLHHDDFFVVNAAEKAVWSIWMRASETDCVAWLAQAVDCIQAEHFEEAESLLDLILIRDPDFAEACNQRAIIHHLTGRYESSIMACHRTLALNPNHHGAAAGLGHNCFHFGRFEEAITAFRKALTIHPRMEGVRQAIRRCQIAASEGTPTQVH